ncbi:hypothetical protein E4U55_006194 [Claviceps digitariae]|nr:hypothetical protein E4U55_006194 [Claviceps digitariae]
MEAVPLSYNDMDLLAHYEYPETLFHQNETSCPMDYGQQDVSTANSAFDYPFLMPMMPHVQLDPSANDLQTNDAPPFSWLEDPGQFYDTMTSDGTILSQSNLFQPDFELSGIWNQDYQDMSLFWNPLVMSNEDPGLSAPIPPSNFFEARPEQHSPAQSVMFVASEPEMTHGPYDTYKGVATSNSPRLSQLQTRSEDAALFPSELQGSTSSHWKALTEAPGSAGRNLDRLAMDEGFSKVSKKTLHHVSCYRGKLTDATLYRKDGLNLTKRWMGTEIRDVSDRLATDVRSIQITFGLCATPISIKVVRFQAIEGDVLAQFWTVREGERGDEVRKKKELEPFCLLDIWETAAYFEKYIIDGAISACIRAHTPNRMLEKTFVGDDVINRAYILAVQHYCQLCDGVDDRSGTIINPQKKLLGSLFVFWLASESFGQRDIDKSMFQGHTTGSAYICGDDTLGMKPEIKDATYPLFGRVAVPPMLVAQLDSINHNKLLARYGHEVLRDLETFIFRNQSSSWWTIYLCTFILLHEASWLSADQYRCARDICGSKQRYAIPSFVEELHDGCNNILIHWHYYNCRGWPNPNAPWERHQHFMSELTSEQFDLVMQTLTDSRIQRQLETWRRQRERSELMERGPYTSSLQSRESPFLGSQTLLDWDHPCYWIAQMFEERWQPHPTYQRESATDFE